MSDSDDAKRDQAERQREQAEQQRRLREAEEQRKGGWIKDTGQPDKDDRPTPIQDDDD
jgi:hypothetical protein